jgi:serine/threonine protein kinase
MKDDINFDPRLDVFFDLAEEDDQDNLELISPSYHSLKKHSQRYKFIEILAKGGMKSIWRVYDQQARRYVAVAKLLDESSTDLYDPFIHEAWLTAKLDHPNIIKVHDVGLDEKDHPYFSMDLKSGTNLREILKNISSDDIELPQKYSLNELLSIFIKICDAMSYAHSQEIIHLDLKPENIQIGEFGEVLICDWGLGRYIGEELQENVSDDLLLNGSLLSKLTINGQISGTPGYMAPEQINQQESRNASTDIYGLGGILYSILTLQRPFSGEDILNDTLQGNLLSPSKRCSHKSIPQSLNAVVMKAMNVEQSARYKNVTELKKEVQNYLSGYTTEAEQASFIKEFKLLYKRNRLLCNSLAISFLLICSVVIISFKGIS